MSVDDELGGTHRPFGELTPAGRVRRLHRLARSLVEERYGLAIARTRLLSRHSLNTILRVETTAGARFALRIGHPTNVFTRESERLEALWLDALASDTDFDIGRVVPTDDGRTTYEVGAAEVGGRRRCTLFEWVAGQPVGPDAAERDAHSVGVVLARLHEHAASLHVSEPDDLREVAALSATHFGTCLLTDGAGEHVATAKEAIERVESALSDLWTMTSDRPRLLHGDFGPHNVMTRRGRLTPIDFQDLRFGLPIQDLGVTMTDLAQHAPGLRDTVRRGYESVLPWPDEWDDLEATLEAQRSLDVMNLGLLLPGTGLADGFDAHVARVRRWLDSP